MAEKGRTFTGARARLSLNGRKVGFATNVNGGEEIEYQPQEVLDNIEVDEWVPVAYRANLTASMIRIVGETLKSQGFFPQAGSSPEEHLTNILLQGDMVATIEDSKTGRTVTTVEQVKVQSKNFTINARGIAAKDVTFVTVRMRDETGG
jgi:hypothetical protein